MRSFKFLVSLLFLVPAFLQADHHRDYADVEGKVYKKVDNYIHELHAEMRVPEQGLGQIVLHLHDRRHAEEVTVESLGYFYKEEAGRTVVYVVFPYKTADQLAVMKGTYLRGSNRVTYFGDAFLAPASMLYDDETLAQHLSTGGCGHLASFYFEERLHGRDHD